jgi:hypothetical protein
MTIRHSLNSRALILKLVGPRYQTIPRPVNWEKSRPEKWGSSAHCHAACIEDRHFTATYQLVRSRRPFWIAAAGHLARATF